MASHSGLRPRMRVCMVTGFLPTPGGGGMEKHVYELVTGLLHRDVDVRIICENRSFLPDPDDSLCDRVIGVSPDSLHAVGWTEQYREKSARFAELLNPSQFDLVHCHNQYGMDVALKLSELPSRPALVSTYHLTPPGQLERFRAVGFPEPEGARIDREVAKMEGISARLSDVCIAVSRGVGQEIARFYHVSEDRIRVIYNWYDERIFKPRDRMEARRILGLSPHGHYVLYVGHFQLERGKLLAEAMRRLPTNVTMLAVFPEEDPDILVEFADRIRFIGYVSSERMALLFAACNLQTFPAVYSGFGLALVEGMACGCPSVVFDQSAMNEIVTPDSGFLVKEPTPAAYAAAILNALAQADAKYEAAVSRASYFRMNPQIDQVLQLYEEVLRGQLPTAQQLEQ